MVHNDALATTLSEFGRKGSTRARRRIRLLAALFCIGLVGVGSVHSANASDIQWSGLYRAEAIRIQNPELSGDGSREKAYALHHLILKPKIVAGDGITIFGRFDLLNNSGFGQNNQAGEFLGQGVGSAPAGSDRNTDNSNVLSRNQAAGGLAVTQLYLSWVQEFGQLIVGRTPLHFGLGLTFNQGDGPFDHFLTTLDMVAYRVVSGNFSVTPMLGKVNEGTAGQEDDVRDYMLHLQYENPDTDLSIGAIYQMRMGGGNDVRINSDAMGGVGSTQAGNYKHNYIGAFTSQKLGSFKVAFEAGVLNGESGVRTQAGQTVKLDAFGAAVEVGYQEENSPWSGLVKFGFASGDDPGSNDIQEGFIANRNYRLGMLMFAHPLGRRDFLRTSLIRDTQADASNQIDTEAISNVIYLNPSLNYKASDRFSYHFALVTGRLNKDPLGGGRSVSSDLGYELNFGIEWKPFERLIWSTDFAALMPGEAFRGGSEQISTTSLTYGMMTRAAIRF